MVWEFLQNVRIWPKTGLNILCSVRGRKQKGRHHYSDTLSVFFNNIKGRPRILTHILTSKTLSLIKGLTKTCRFRSSGNNFSIGDDNNESQSSIEITNIQFKNTELTTSNPEDQTMCFPVKTANGGVSVVCM